MLSLGQIFTKIEEGLPVVLRNTTNGSDKYYIFWLKKPHNLEWSVSLHYGKVGYPGLLRVLQSNTANTWSSIRHEVSELLRQKTNKGYVYFGSDPSAVINKKNCPITYPTKPDDKPTNTDDSDYDNVLL